MANVGVDDGVVRTALGRVSPDVGAHRRHRRKGGRRGVDVHHAASRDTRERVAFFADFHQRNVRLAAVHGVAGVDALHLVADDAHVARAQGRSHESALDPERQEADEQTDQVHVFGFDLDCVAAISIEDVAEEQAAVSRFDDEGVALVGADHHAAFGGDDENERGGAHGGTPEGFGAGE